MVLLLILLAASVPAVPATGPALEADAGFSVVVHDGAGADVAGRARGGAAPYRFAWTHEGSPARFLDASASATTFDTAGLRGPATLTLVVTDALGATASDMVVVIAGRAPVLLSRTIVVEHGVPDDAVVPSAISPDRKAFTFSMPADIARVDATLSWPGGVDDLDLELSGPGASSGAQGRTGANPERVVLESPRSGTWTARILPVLSAGTTATLTVQGFTGGLPAARQLDAQPYGTLDAQETRLEATRGTAPSSFAWDLDGDGWFETEGSAAVTTRPAGAHALPYKLTDGAGLEVRGEATLVVRDAERALRISCSGDGADYAAMEFAQSGGTCWVHGGHHTYSLGGDRAVLRGFEGIAFAVEQQFAPSAPPPEAPDAWAMHVETSEDGTAWTEVGRGRYLFTSQRQYVAFGIEDVESPFRMIRIRAPLSATQGLSGYLDHTEGWMLVDGLRPAPAPPLAPGTRAFSCERDLVEDFFATHPCWFGGVDRYDAPSFWHTYVVGGGARLDRVTGSFTLMPWRLDDWNQANATTNASGVRAFLMTSVDGVAWETRAELQATYGAPTPFDVELGGVEARFVRLFPEEHARFHQAAEFAPNHHPKGYFVDSRLVVEGELPPP